MRDVGSAATDHVVRTRQRGAASRQPIVVLQLADVGQIPRVDPTLDETVFVNREAVCAQDVAHHDIVTVDLHLNRFKPEVVSVRKSTLDDVRNELGSCVRHKDRVERDSITPVSCDDGSFRLAELVEPKQLRQIVGCARHAPPPLQIGCFVQPSCGMSTPRSLQ